jgi:hypothetical protein
MEIPYGLAYSSSNKDFNGSSGELFRFKLKPAVSSGTYSLNIVGPFFQMPLWQYYESDSFDGSLTITLKPFLKHLCNCL